MRPLKFSGLVIERLDREHDFSNPLYEPLRVRVRLTNDADGADLNAFGELAYSEREQQTDTIDVSFGSFYSPNDRRITASPRAVALLKTKEGKTTFPFHNNEWLLASADEALMLERHAERASRNAEGRLCSYQARLLVRLVLKLQEKILAVQPDATILPLERFQLELRQLANRAAAFVPFLRDGIG